MITVKEEIVISHDEPLAELYSIKLTQENGWFVEEDTVAKTYKRIHVFIGETDDHRQSNNDTCG